MFAVMAMPAGLIHNVQMPTVELLACGGRAY